MTLNSLEELRKFDKIILSEDKVNANYIKKYFNNTNKKILILFVSNELPKNIEVIKKNNKNCSFKLFSWSLFHHRYYEKWYSHKISIKNSELIYKNISEKNKFLIWFFKKLYSSEDIQLGFKKNIAIHLQKYYEIIKIYELIKEHNNNVVPVLDKNKYLNVKKIIPSNISEEIKTDFHKKILFDKQIFFNKKLYLNLIIFIFYPFFSLLSIRKFKIKDFKKTIGLRMYKQGLGFDRRKHYSDWIIDGKHFNSKNSIFVFEDTPRENHLNEVKKNKYNFHYCTNRIPLKTCSLRFFIKILFIYIPLGIIISPLLFFANKLLRDEAITAWLKFFSWKNFISIFQINSYLSYHNYTSDHIYRNILLKKIGCSSIMYKHSHSENVFDYKNKDKYAHVDLMHLYYDIEYHWSNCSIETTLSNKTKSRKLLISGPIWSSRQLLNKKYEINNSKDKISVALFTTAFGGFNSNNPTESHKKFLLLAQEIITNFPNVNILFKPKGNFKIYQTNDYTSSLTKNLSNLKNFNIVDNFISSNSILKASDVVISMPFASSGLEAMCFGAKSFYVDSANIYKNSYFDNFERLICHSNESALENLEFWIKADKQKVSLIYKKIFQDMGLESTDRATEIIRDKIIHNVLH